MQASFERVGIPADYSAMLVQLDLMVAEDGK